MFGLIVKCITGDWKRRRTPQPAQPAQSSSKEPPPPPQPAIPDDPDAPLGPLFAPPLRTSGRYILDAAGQRFKLLSLNYYGASDELFVPGGLDVRHRDAIARLIRRMGFNSIRLPYSDELVLRNPVIPAARLAANPDLAGSTALDVLAAVVRSLTDAGLAVIVNNHITHARWFDGISLCDASWKNDHLGPVCRIRQTEESWIANWETVMRRFADNPLVVGCDLRNEVHGIWGTVKWSDWARAAERCAERLLAMNGDWLIVVEGVESANNLGGVRSRPVRLSVPDKLVYSSHVYSWSGWGEFRTMGRSSYADFEGKMQDKWGFILDEGIAPVWLGEMGVPDVPSAVDRNYWDNLVALLGKWDVDWGYWAINPRKPHEYERESYGLVGDDWETVLEDYRIRDMRRLMVVRQGPGAGSGDGEGDGEVEVGTKEIAAATSLDTPRA